MSDSIPTEQVETSTKDQAFIEGGWRRQQYLFILLLMLLITAAAIGIAFIPGSGIIAAITVTLVTLLGITAGPMLPFILLGIGGMLLGLEIGCLASAATLSKNANLLAPQTNPRLTQRNFSRLALIAGLVLGITVAIVAFPAFPWFIAGLIGFGISVALLVILAAALNFPAPGFLKQFFTDLLPQINLTAKEDLGLKPTQQPTPLQSLSKEKEFTNVLPTLDDLKIPAYENPTENKQFFQAIAKSIETAKGTAIEALYQVCVDMQSPSTSSPQERLFKLDQALQACAEAKEMTTERALVKEKLGQYKALVLDKIMGNPKNILLLIKNYTSDEKEPNYTLLLSNLPIDTLRKLYTALDEQLTNKVPDGGRLSLNAYFPEETAMKPNQDKLKKLQETVQKTIGPERLEKSKPYFE